MSDHELQAETLREEAREAALRRWLIEQAPAETPSSLSRALETVTARPHPVRAARAHRSTVGLVSSRIGSQRAVAALAAGVVVVVATGLLLTGTRLGPAASPSAAILSPSSGPSSSSLLRIGSPHVLATVAAPISAIAEAGPSAIVATSGLGVVAMPPGGTCTGFQVGTVDPNDNVTWTSPPFGWIEQMAKAGKGVDALVLGSDCHTRSIQLTAATGYAWDPVSPGFTDAVDWFGVGPAGLLARWRWDGSKGGFLSWLTVGGSWSTVTSEALPLGWDAAGTFWQLAPDGTLLRGRGPGFSAERTTRQLDLSWSWQAGERPPAFTAIAGDRLLVGGTSGGLESVSLVTDAPAVTIPDFEAFAFGVGIRLMVAVGTVRGEPALALSSDGVTWTTAALPGGLVTKSNVGWAVGVVARTASDEVVVGAPEAEGSAIIAVPVSGATSLLATSPPTPTPGPSEVGPSIPPPVVTSSWTKVTDLSAESSATGGPRGFSVSALPDGGFIAFDGQPGGPIRVLRSADGLHWTLLSTIPAAPRAVPTGPLATDGHSWVLMGYEGGGLSYGSQSNGAAWVSPDLVHWSKAPGQAAFDGVFSYSGLVAGPAGFVAVGTSQSERSVWMSSDGLHWSSPTTGPFSGQQLDQAAAIFTTSSGYLVAGSSGTSAAVFTSVDAKTWATHLVPVGKASGFERATRFGSGFLALTGGPPIEVAPDDFRAPLVPWTSRDGLSWAAGPPADALFGAEVASMAGAPGGLVAGGSVLVGTPGAPSQTAALWTSQDGTSWDRVAGIDLGPAQQMDGVVSDGRHVVAWAGDMVWVSDGIAR